MPYDIRRKGDKWITYNKETGETKGTHDSREDAIKQMRLLYGVEGGMKPTGEKSNMDKKMPPKGMHRMPDGHMMKDSEMRGMMK